VRAALEVAALALVSGLLYGCALLLVSVGLTLIFGIGRVVNFAHGTLYALGAFLGASIDEAAGGQGWGLLTACIAASLLVGAAAWLLDILLLRRLRGYGEMPVLLFTFGLGIVLDAGIVAVWRGRSFSVPIPDALAGSFTLWGGALPFYAVFLAIVSVAITAAILAGLHHTDAGLRLRAAAENPATAEIAGVDVDLAFTAMFAFGSALAALAGVLALPLVGASNGMDLPVTVLVFIIAIVGGLGSLPGTVLTSLLVGVILTLGATYASSSAYMLLFAAVIATLLVCPFGLMGSRAQ
jgi:branched-chain amino acid transport system permease protein